MSDTRKYAATKSVARKLSAKQVRTLNDLFSYTPGLWNDGLAAVKDAKDYKGYYPTYEGIAGMVKRFPEYRLLGSDISQQILKNTLCVGVANFVNYLKGTTQMAYNLPSWKRQGEELPLMIPVRESYLDREARTVTVPMSNAYRSMLKADAEKTYKNARKIVAAYEKCHRDEDKYLKAAIKAYRKDNPKKKIKKQRLSEQFMSLLEEALVIVKQKKGDFVKSHIDARRVVLPIPERVDIDALSQFSITRHKHGQYYSIEWKEREPEHDLPETPAELPQAIHPTPSVEVAMKEAQRRLAEFGDCVRVDATIDLNVKNLIVCTLLAVCRKREYSTKKNGKKTWKLVEVATPFYSFVMDGGWLLSIYRATAKDAAKLTAEMDAWKNIRGEKSWGEKRCEIVEKSNGKKQPTTCRRQRHINAVRNKRRARHENGKRRADVAIDIIVKSALAIMGAGNVSRVCVGHNAQQKSQCKLKHGSIASQAFQSINYTRIRMRLEHWCGIFGWSYVESEESYTSKVSAYDLEELPTWDGVHHREREYVGKRICRGLFRCADGTIINADVNGALNIWRKCSLDCRLVRSERLAGVYHPYRVSAEVMR